MILGGKRFAAMLIMIVFPQIGIVGQTMNCSHVVAEKTDYEASRLQTWDKLHHSYLHYSGCDDGSIWAGYSDSVVRLLTHRWDTLPETFPLFASDAGFYKFVPKHIDATTLADDLKMTRANATRSCPTEGSEYC